jgi:hypothetical protein
MIVLFHLSRLSGNEIREGSMMILAEPLGKLVALRHLVLEGPVAAFLLD